MQPFYLEHVPELFKFLSVCLYNRLDVCNQNVLLVIEACTDRNNNVNGTLRRITTL